MSHGISRRTSVPELSRKILEMATTGIYRESIFEALQPLSTKKNIRLAIAHAKQCGMYSVANLRDDILGTYYQIDLAQYRASQDALQSPLMPDNPIEAVQLAADVVSAMRWVVRLTLFATILLTSFGLSCRWLGYENLQGGLLVSAGIIWAIWHLQRRLLRSFLAE